MLYIYNQFAIFAIVIHESDSFPWHGGLFFWWSLKLTHNVMVSDGSCWSVGYAFYFLRVVEVHVVSCILRVMEWSGRCMFISHAEFELF